MTSNEKQTQVSIHEELALFDSSNVIGPGLQFLIDNLLLIRPTSVDPERTFSTCGLLDAPQRGSLGPAKFSKIIFINQNLYKINLN